MRALSGGIIVSVLVGLCAVAVAQPQNIMKKRDKDKDSKPNVTLPGQDKKPAPSDNNDKNSPAMCMARQAVLTQERERLGDIKANLAGAAAEIAQLRRQLSEAERRQAALQRAMPDLEKRVVSIAQSLDRDCSASNDCNNYEGRASQLESQSKPVEQQLDAVRSEIESNRREVASMNGRIEPLRQEYATLGCGNMVPGQTTQQTIDRCSAIFSEWNRLQTDINAQNNRVPLLKSRYEELFARLKGMETQAKDYETYLAKNCTQSAKLQSVRRYGGVRESAERMGRELDSLIEDVTKLRGVQITVTAR